MIVRQHQRNPCVTLEEGWWMEDITVMRSLASSRRVTMRALAAVESSPLVGSSRIRMLGLVNSSVPIWKRGL